MARFLLDISGHGHNHLVLSRLCRVNGNKVGKSLWLSDWGVEDVDKSEKGRFLLVV